MKYTYSSAQSVEKLDPKVAQLCVTEEKESYVLHQESGRNVVRLGVEDRKSVTRRQLVLLARRGIALAKSQRIKRLAVSLADFTFPHLRMSEMAIGELFAVNFEMANYEFVKYKTPPKGGWSMVEEIVVYGKIGKEAKKGIEKGRIVGEAVNAARTLSNTPGGEMTPRVLAKAAQDAAKNTNVLVRILGLKEMQKLSMGGVLGVAKGSLEEPQFIIAEYFGGGKKEQPIVLVGKGVTFDTGGLNIKPGDAMNEMHMDMSGGAAVLLAVILGAKLGLKKNVVALVPAVENMPSGSSYRPGDILRTMSGKTIEVLNTDAEGRIILADALTYAKKYRPRLVVDVATLAGATMSALGQRASAIYTRDEKLEKLFRELGEESGDYVWPLPLWDEYEEDIKGTFGDVINLGKTKYGGAITGAIFLYQFAKDYPWVHIDICPRMTSIEGEFLAKGATGVPVRLLAKMLERL